MFRKTLIPLILIGCPFISNAQTQVLISPALLYFDYTEFTTSNTVLNHESGWLPGIDTKLIYDLTSDWVIKIYSSYYQGSVNYTGETQSGLPHKTETDTNIFRLGSRIEARFYHDLYFFVAAQSRRWHRDIIDNNTVSGLKESYKWVEYSIGINSVIYNNDWGTFNLEAGYLLVDNARLNVDLSRVNLGSTNIDLTDTDGASINLLWNSPGEKNFSYGIEFFVEVWDFNRSSTQLTLGGDSSVLVTEPESESYNTGLKLNFKFHY